MPVKKKPTPKKVKALFFVINDGNEVCCGNSYDTYAKALAEAKNHVKEGIDYDHDESPIFIIAKTVAEISGRAEGITFDIREGT